MQEEQRTMNYFELLGLPVQLRTDKAEVKRRYLELSRQHHPDYFVNNDTAAQENALEVSALLNKALRTLSDPDSTIAYVLTQKGLLEAEEKYSLDADFLMEMMDLNEEVAEAETAEQKEALAKKINTIEGEIYETVRACIEGYREDGTSEEELLQVKDYYFRKKYLERLRRQLGGML